MGVPVRFLLHSIRPGSQPDHTLSIEYRALAPSARSCGAWCRSQLFLSPRASHLARADALAFPHRRFSHEESNWVALPADLRGDYFLSLFPRADHWTVDPVRALATEFGTQWLHVRAFDEFNEKNEKLFPTFTTELRKAINEESVLFFQDLFQNDRPYQAIVDAVENTARARMELKA